MCKSVAWNPWSGLLENSNKYAIVILNSPLNFNKTPSLLENLWSSGEGGVFEVVIGGLFIIL